MSDYKKTTQKENNITSILHLSTNSFIKDSTAANFQEIYLYNSKLDDKNVDLCYIITEKEISEFSK